MNRRPVRIRRADQSTHLEARRSGVIYYALIDHGGAEIVQHQFLTHQDRTWKLAYLNRKCGALPLGKGRIKLKPDFRSRLDEDQARLRRQGAERMIVKRIDDSHRAPR